MTEDQMLDGIKDYAQRLGYLTYHTFDSRRSDKGFPDLTIAGHGVVFFWELKGPRGVVSADQDRWNVALLVAGQAAAIIWPEDYDWALQQLEAAAENRQHS